MSQPRSRPAAVVAVGSELVNGTTLDTNSSWLAHQLWVRGWSCRLVLSCPDELEAIEGALRHARGQAELLVVTGGLGPTSDDLTRDAVARVIGAPLELRPALLERIEQLFARFGRAMPPSNRRQAELPRGALELINDVGTAPGFRVDLDGAPLYVLPGVPREMRWLWEHRVLPGLEQVARLEERVLRTVGISESALGERLVELEREPEVEVRYCVEEEQGTIRVTLLLAGAPARAEALLARAREAIGDHVVSEGPETLAARVGRLLLERGRTVATAESCTGGRIAAALTSIPGISAAYQEGLVTYSNEAKTRLLGVPAELIAAHGAVSAEVARAMAAGARARAGADLGLSVTGIAGPGGGSPEKPVGLVHLAVAHTGGVDHLERRFPGDRQLVQARATAVALDLLRRRLA